MNNPQKQKPPEKDLALAMIGCWIFALMMFGSCAWAFLHRTDLVIKKDTVPISTYNSVLDLVLVLTIQMPFYLGLAFFSFGYIIWKAHRKLRLAKRHENPVA
jgi:hypothetical protein